MQKIRCELDPHNRLIAAGSGRKTALSKFRKVLDGQFKMDENNNLSYHVKAPLRKDENIPNQIRLKGDWSLTDDHNLRLTLDKSARETFGDEITLEGEILDVDKNSLLFAVATTTKAGTKSIYVLKFAGSWKSDENNRLSFCVRREKGRYDILTLNGAWEVNKNHELIYQYEKARLIRKKRDTHTLTFKGYWDIKDRARISYILNRDTDSFFDFNATAGIFKENYIKYEIGIDLTNRKRPLQKTVTLSGRWNLKKDIGLTFEVEYTKGKTRAIVFGADAKLTDKDTVLFRLKNDIENKDIGVNLELSHKILKEDGEAFLRALTSRRETAIYAGAAWRW